MHPNGERGSSPAMPSWLMTGTAGDRPARSPAGWVNSTLTHGAAAERNLRSGGGNCRQSTKRARPSILINLRILEYSRAEATWLTG